MDDPRGQGWHREEHRDVEDEHVDVAGVEANAGEEVGDGGVEEGVHLVERVVEGGRVLAVVEDAPSRSSLSVAGLCSSARLAMGEVGEQVRSSASPFA